MVAKVVGEVNKGAVVMSVLPPNVGKSGGDDKSLPSSDFDSVISDSVGRGVGRGVGRVCDVGLQKTPAKCPLNARLEWAFSDCDVGDSDCDDVRIDDLPRVWGVVKLGNEKLAEMYERAVALGFDVISPNRLNDLRRCGEYLRFAHLTGGKKKLAAASFCRWRLCPICQWRRSLKLFGQAAEILKCVVNERPKCRFLFLTVTVQNVEVSELGNALDAITAAFGKLMKTVKPVRGWIRCTEITVNPKTGMTHPHIHAVILVDADYFHNSYIKQAKWAEMWKSALGVDYVPCLDIKSVREKGVGAIAEISGVFKYSIKGGGDVVRLAEMGDYGIEILAQLTRTLHKRRFVAFGGEILKIRQRMRLGDAENLTDKDEVKAAEMAGLIEGYRKYRWECRSGVYVEM